MLSPRGQLTHWHQGAPALSTTGGSEKRYSK
jgi:hypothetical protein